MAQRKADVDSALEALLWCVEHFEAIDQANAKMHCAPVRYSPITFRVANAYNELANSGRVPVQGMPNPVLAVLGHEGAYELDPGR